MEFCVAKGAVKKHRQVTLQIGQIESWGWLHDTKLYFLKSGIVPRVHGYVPLNRTLMIDV